MKTHTEHCQSDHKKVPRVENQDKRARQHFHTVQRDSDDLMHYEAHKNRIISPSQVPQQVCALVYSACNGLGETCVQKVSTRRKEKPSHFTLSALVDPLR